MGSHSSLRKGVLAIAFVVFVLGWIAVLPTASARGGYTAYDSATHTFAVSPTGGDDTANIQAAFDGCAEEGPECTVLLERGTFHTAQIVAVNFRGTFRGMGVPSTVVEALPELPVVFDGLRLPSQDNPYPMLFIFLEGKFTVSDMTISEPWSEPLVEWLPCPTCPTMHAMHSVVATTGQDLEVTVQHVMLLGAPGDCVWNGLNTINGITSMPLIVAPGGTDVSDLLPVHAEFLATDNAFNTVGSPLGFELQVGSRITARNNFFDTTDYPFGFIDAADSVFEFSHNVARNVFLGAGVQAWQGYNTFFELFPFGVPSRLIVTDNDLQVTNIAQGVLLIDYSEFSGYERSLDTVISGNTIRTDATSLEGVLGVFQRSTIVSKNEIIGAGPVGVRFYGGPGQILNNEIRGSGVGVVLEGASGVLIKANEIHRSGFVGIVVAGAYDEDGVLLAESSNNLVVRNEVHGSGIFDLFWDGVGTGNAWIRNECQTSEPPGMCSNH